MTWLNFVRRPDDGASKKRCRGQDKKSVSPGVYAQDGDGCGSHSYPHFLLLPHSEAPLAPQDPPVRK